MYLKYRIKEVNGKFIPQKLGFIFFVPTWFGIDKKDGYNWLVEDFQYSNCACETIEEAKEVINNFRPKYHKL